MTNAEGNETLHTPLSSSSMEASLERADPDFCNPLKLIDPNELGILIPLERPIVHL
jgi:hypothetical protein